MNFDRLTCSDRRQCALVGGIPGWVAAVVVVIVGSPHGMLLASLLFVPVTVASGIVAGYLRDGGTRESAVVGGFAGGVAVLPAILVPLFFFVMVFTAEGGEVGWGLALFVFTSVVFVVATLVAAALGALGGVAWGRHSSRGRRPGRARESGAPKSASGERGGSLDHELTDATARQDRSAGRTSENTGRASAAGTSSPGAASSGDKPEDPVTDGAGSRWFYGLVGGLVGLILLPATIVLPFFPLGAVLCVFVGGGAAGYLQARDPRDGAIVGAFAGAVTIIPILAFFLVTHRGAPLRDVVSTSVTGLPFAAGAVAFSTFGGTWGAILSERGPPETDRRGNGSEAVSRGGTVAGVPDPPGHSTGPTPTNHRPGSGGTTSPETGEPDGESDGARGSSSRTEGSAETVGKSRRFSGFFGAVVGIAVFSITFVSFLGSVPGVYVFLAALGVFAGLTGDYIRGGRAGEGDLSGSAAGGFVGVAFLAVFHVTPPPYELFVPFVLPGLLGGGLAGYLRRGGLRNGAIVGFATGSVVHLLGGLALLLLFVAEGNLDDWETFALFVLVGSVASVVLWTVGGVLGATVSDRPVTPDDDEATDPRE